MQNPTPAFIASTVLMVCPTHFRYNEQTATNNSYQRPSEGSLELAVQAFEGLVAQLRAAGIEVLTYEDLPTTPDAVFPNNWISFEANGDICLFPMYAPNRRLERRTDLVLNLLEQNAYAPAKIHPYYHYEEQGRYLEGTGSMIIDRKGGYVYANRSLRTHDSLVQLYCADWGYEPILFDAFDSASKPIYHTNVLMSLSPRLALIGLDTIPEGSEKRRVCETLRATGREIISLSMAQINAFAANALYLQNAQGDCFWVMSESAKNAFTPAQMELLTADAQVIYAPIEFIEQNGGGSVRCMIAEVFTPKKVQ
jgi:hypothetical protein